MCSDCGSCNMFAVSQKWLGSLLKVNYKILISAESSFHNNPESAAWEQMDRKRFYLLPLKNLSLVYNSVYQHSQSCTTITINSRVCVCVCTWMCAQSRARKDITCPALSLSTLIPLRQDFSLNPELSW